MKKVTIASYDIDIEKIQDKIRSLQEELSGSAMKNFVPKTVLKDMEELQKKLDVFRKTSPTSNSTNKEILKFLQSWEKIENEIDLVDSKLAGLSFSNSGIKENIEEVSELVSKLKEATQARKEYEEKISSSAGVKKVSQTGPYREKMEKTREKFIASAKLGTEGTEKIKSDAANMREKINARITTISETWSPEKQKEYLPALKERLKELNSMELSALEYARRQQVLIDNEKQLTEELEEQVNIYQSKLNTATEKHRNTLGDIKGEVKDTTAELQRMAEVEKRQEERQAEIDSLTRRVKDVFSVSSAIFAVRRVIRGAIQDFQELDKQFNEIAIVSDYTTKEMWSSFSSVNKVAQEFGVQTKNVLEVQNLYYHQGKDMAEVNKLTAQTLTLAKITGMDYERATSDLTAALNAYNIAAEDAVRVTDTIAAMDTNAAISSEELMTALTKTASIAANAGMSLESTEVFLTKMIETTREAPENLGTALKTIIARFGEVKQEIDGEEIELADINKVDTALKSIGISLLDTAGQIRDLDDVFMELSSKWDGLDRNTQRYIATIAAGSRQQSRFIAMMEDYDRTLELAEIAQNSAGLGARQLSKSMESIESSVNRLKSSWQEFYSSIINAGIIKTVLDAANSFLGLLNALPGPLSVLVGALALWIVKTQIVDKVILKLGQSIGESIGQGTVFEALLLSTVSSLDEESRKLLLASKAFDKYRDSIEKASLTKKSFSDMTPDEKRVFSQQRGILNEKGDLTLLGEKYLQANDKYLKKGKGALDIDEFLRSPKGSYFKGKQDTLTKLLGEKGLSEYLKNTQGLKGTKLFSKGIKEGTKGIGTMMKAGTKGLLTSAGSALSGIAGSLGAILTTLGPILAVVGAIVAAVVVWKQTMKASLDDTKSIEKLTKAQEEYNKNLQKTNDLKTKAKKYKEFTYADGSLKSGLSTEQMQEQQELAKEIVAEYPSLLEKIDEEGNYHLKNADAIQAEIDKKEELLEQSHRTYQATKLSLAKKGVYSDTNTRAGQAMKDIQDYAATFGTEDLNKNEDLKAIAKKIDKDNNFNKSAFYDIMEAYATGKKSSFDNKDFTDLFAGNISDAGWTKLLEAVQKDEGKLTQKDLEKYLSDTGSYGEEEAKEVAKTFMELDSQMGGVYTNLLQGAAEAFSELEIQQAKFIINQGNFEWDMGTEFSDAMAAEAQRMAEQDSRYESASLEGRTDIVEEYAEQLVKAMEGLDEDTGLALEEIFSKTNLGGLTSKEVDTTKLGNITKTLNDPNASDADIKEAEKAREEVVLAIFNALGPEITEGVSEIDIKGYSENIIAILFSAISEALPDQVEFENFINNYSKDYAGLYDDDKIKSKIGKSDFENFTEDQKAAFLKKTGALPDEQVAPYVTTLLKGYDEIGVGTQKASEFLNEFLNIDLSDVTTTAETATKALRKFGYTTEESMEMAVRAAGGIENISLGTYEDSVKNAEETIAKTSEELEGLTRLTKGEGTFEDLEKYKQTMEDFFTEQGKNQGLSQEKLTGFVSDEMNKLNQAVLVTGEGFKLSSADSLQYGDSLIAMSKDAIAAEVALLQLQLATGKLSAEQEADVQSRIDMYTQVYNQLDAQKDKAYFDGVSSGADKAKEKADDLLSAMQNLVKWLREFDRYANLDRVIEDLENDFEHLEFEIKFTTNSSVVKKDIEKQIGIINSEIAANQGGIAAAKDDQSMWRDVIEKRNSGYVTFDDAGNAIVNAEKLQKLQEEISQTDKEHRDVIQAKYDEIMDNVEAYNKSKEKVNEYTEALEKNFESLKTVLQNTYEAVTKVEDKLIKVRQEKEDEELEAIKEKYDAIKEEDEKYLESVRRTIDKERELRDLQDQQNDVKDKEKKLAMMKMDTSGIYKSSIKSLEKELSRDYRQLEDNAVDRAISDLEKQTQAQAEARDKEIEYLENTLEYKREKMTEYNKWASELLKKGSDEVLKYLKKNDKEYYTGTAAAKKAWSLEWNGAVAQAIGANEAMKGSIMQNVYNSLMSCTGAAGGFEAAVVSYSSTARAENKAVRGSVEKLTEYYGGLAGGVEGVTTELGLLDDAYWAAAEAADGLAGAQGRYNSALARTIELEGELNTVNKNGKRENRLAGAKMEKYTTEVFTEYGTVYTKDYMNANRVLINGVTYIKSKKFGGTDTYIKEEHFADTIGGSTPMAGSPYYKLKYAEGGFADFTGPAWLDGTKNKPEAVLNPLQTKHFIQFTNVLDTLFSNTSLPNASSKASQEANNATYNFNINVDQMASDYDVDKLISRIEEKMVKSSQYRNVNIVKKRN